MAHQTQISSLQLKCNKLKKQNKDLTSQVNTLLEDKEDISEYLKFVMVEEKKKVEELDSQLQAIHQDTEALKLLHSQQMQKLQEQFDELNSVNIMKEAQLEEQKEQLKQMMQQLSDQESLEKQLISEKQEHEAAMFQLKIEEELERKRLIEETQMEVDEGVKTRSLFIIQEERIQLKENFQQTRFLLETTTPLRNKKIILKDTEKKLHKEIDHLKTHLNNKNQKSFSCKKELKQMKQRCQQLEVELHDCRVINKNMLDKEKNLRGDVASESEKCTQQTPEINQQTPELQKKTSRCLKLEDVMRKSVMTLKHITMTSYTQHKKQMLLELLERTAPQQTVSTLSISKDKSSEGQKPQSTDPKTASTETLHLDTDPLFLLSRLRPGDFGFIPRPTWKLKPAAPTTTLPPLKREYLNRDPCPLPLLYRLRAGSFGIGPRHRW